MAPTDPPGGKATLKLLGFVSCPVALYTGVQRAGDVHFNMLHKTTHNRIRMVPTDPETGPVDRDDIVKGFEVDKDRYVVVTQDEIDNVRLESTRTIDISRFVDAADIDRLYWDEPYYMAPDGKEAVEAFAVIRDAMKKAGRIALGRVVMHQRERLLALEPYEEGAWSPGPCAPTPRCASRTRSSTISRPPRPTRRCSTSPPASSTSWKARSTRPSSSTTTRRR